MANRGLGTERGSIEVEAIASDESLSVAERRAILSSIAKDTNLNRQFHTNDRMVAIDLLNKMDNLYKQEIKVEHEVVKTFVFMLPDGTEFVPGLEEGKEKKALTEGEGAR